MSERSQNSQSKEKVLAKMFAFGQQSWGNQVKCSAERFDLKYRVDLIKPKKFKKLKKFQKDHLLTKEDDLKNAGKQTVSGPQWVQ